MLSLNKIINTPWGFKSEVIELKMLNEEKGQVDTFSLKILEGPLVGQIMKLKVTAREQDNFDTVLRRVQIKILDGPKKGTEQWISSKGLLSEKTN